VSYRRVPDIDPRAKEGIVEDLKMLRLRSQLAQRALGRALQDAAVHGFSYRELAQELGVSHVTIGRWVRDATQT
jgi:DNA-directed RNA polymerase specialized sigma24 family protein